MGVFHYSFLSQKKIEHLTIRNSQFASESSSPSQKTKPTQTKKLHLFPQERYRVLTSSELKKTTNQPTNQPTNQMITHQRGFFHELC